MSESKLPKPLKDIAITAKRRYNLYPEIEVKEITFKFLSTHYKTESHFRLVKCIYEDMLLHSSSHSSPSSHSSKTPPVEIPSTFTSRNRRKDHHKKSHKKSHKKIKRTSKAIKKTVASEITEVAEKADI